MTPGQLWILGAIGFCIIVLVILAIVNERRRR